MRRVEPLVQPDPDAAGVREDRRRPGQHRGQRARAVARQDAGLAHVQGQRHRAGRPGELLGHRLEEGAVPEVGVRPADHHDVVLGQQHRVDAVLRPHDRRLGRSSPPVSAAASSGRKTRSLTASVWSTSWTPSGSSRSKTYGGTGMPSPARSTSTRDRRSRSANSGSSSSCSRPTSRRLLGITSSGRLGSSSTRRPAPYTGSSQRAAATCRTGAPRPVGTQLELAGPARRGPGPAGARHQQQQPERRPATPSPASIGGRDGGGQHDVPEQVPVVVGGVHEAGGDAADADPAEHRPARVDPQVPAEPLGPGQHVRPGVSGRHGDSPTPAGRRSRDRAAQGRRPALPAPPAPDQGDPDIA